MLRQLESMRKNVISIHFNKYEQKHFLRLTSSVLTFGCRSDILASTEGVGLVVREMSPSDSLPM